MTFIDDQAAELIRLKCLKAVRNALNSPTNDVRFALAILVCELVDLRPQCPDYTSATRFPSCGWEQCILSDRLVIRN